MSLYFRTDWLIRRLKKEGRGTGGALMAVGDIANESPCLLVMYASDSWYLRSDGCHVIPFKWRVPSRAALEKCMLDVGDYMQFSEPQPISKEEFYTGNTYAFAADLLTSLEGALYIEELAEANEQILASTHEMFEKIIISLNGAGQLREEYVNQLRQLPHHDFAQIITQSQLDKDRETILALAELCAHAGNLLPEQEQISKAFSRFLHVPDWEVRWMVVEAIGRLEAPDRLAILRDVVAHDDHDYVGQRAVHQIRHLPEAIPELISIADDHNLTIGVREQAIKELGNLRFAGLLSHLVSQLDDASPRIRHAAIIALRDLQDAEAIPHLEKLLNDQALNDSGQTIARAAQFAIAYLKPR